MGIFKHTHPESRWTGGRTMLSDVISGSGVILVEAAYPGTDTW